MTVDWFELSYRVLGGLCVFLFGMRALSESLQALASDFLRRVIGWLTTNRLMGVLIGFVVTGIIQSSSVTTVMVIGFVNAGLMTIAQAIGVILGANIGTTVTGWIIALKIGKYGLAFLGLGLIPFFFSKNFKARNLGKICIALGFIFLGLEFMSNGFKPLSRDPGFVAWMSHYQADSVWPILACAAIGCILTFIVQSSSAMLGVTIALATTAAAGQHPVITLETAIALVLGQNIGTTITAQLAAIGGNVNAKRAAWAHTIFNVTGVVVILPLFHPFMWFINEVIGPAFDVLSGLYKANTVDGAFALVGFKIAAAHTTFNVVNVLVFFPFVGTLAKLVERIKPAGGMRAKKRLKVLGPISQISPELALEQAEGEVRLMSKVVLDLLTRMRKYALGVQEDLELKGQIDHCEGVTDNIQKEVTLFLTTVLQMPLNPGQSTRGYQLIRTADELESIADYCQSMGNYKQRLLRDEETFSDTAHLELTSLLDATIRFVEESVAFCMSESEQDVNALLTEAENLGRQADAIRVGHLHRVQTGTCDALAGMTFSDMIVALRRIKNHAVNLLDAKVSRWEEPRESLRVPASETSTELGKLRLSLQRNSRF